MPLTAEDAVEPDKWGRRAACEGRRLRERGLTW